MALAATAQTVQALSAACSSPELARSFCREYTAMVEAAMQPTVVMERPPPGPARGKWEAPGWAIVVIVLAAVLLSLAYWLVRLRRSRKSQP